MLAELDQALNVRFGRRRCPAEAKCSASAPTILYGRAITDYQPPDEYALTPEQRRLVTTFANDVLQVASLVGGPRDLELPNYDPAAHQEVGRRFANQQEQMRGIRRQYGYHRGEKAGRAASVDVFDEFNVRITEALEQARLHWGHLYELKQSGLEAFIQDVPIIYAHRELRRLRQVASQKPWEENDLTGSSRLLPPDDRLLRCGRDRAALDRRRPSHRPQQAIRNNRDPEPGGSPSVPRLEAAAA